MKTMIPLSRQMKYGVSSHFLNLFHEVKAILGLLIVFLRFKKREKSMKSSFGKVGG